MAKAGCDSESGENYIPGLFVVKLVSYDGYKVYGRCYSLTGTEELLKQFLISIDRLSVK